MATKKGSQTPTMAVTLPYKKSHGKEAVEFYNSTGRKAQPWQESLLKHILGVNSSGLYVHMNYGLEVPRRNGQNEVKLGQFQTASATPHLEQLKMFASLFAGETGLTLDDLGFATENPSSSEAIKAQHENLRLAVRSAQNTFGVGLLNACFLAACVRDRFEYSRQQIYNTRLQWMPAFPADASMLGAIGDALGKMAASFPAYLDEDKIFDLTGI